MKQFFTLLVLILSTQMLFAWGKNGHRIVAKICYDNLNPQAREKVDEALGNNFLAQVADWPDYIRSEKNWDFAKAWHFATIHPHETVQDVVEKNAKDPKINDVIEAIELMRDILKDDKNAIELFEGLMKENKVEPLAGSIHATALAFLVHFIGDIHQPLHVGKNRDLGGNKITVLFFNERKNIHSVWDSGIIDQEKLSYTEFSAFIEKHIRHTKESVEDAAIAKWAVESVEHREHIYNTLYDNTDRDSGLPNLSYNYQHDFLPIVEKRLGEAGYRAAVMINAILG